MNYLELLHRCAAPAWDKQMALGDLIGDAPRWDADLKRGVIMFGGHTFRVQVLGSESARSNTWLWAWANSASDLPPALFTAANHLRAYGDQYPLAELTTPHHDVSATVNGHTLAMVASIICGANAYYRAPYEGGAVFLLIRDLAYPQQEYAPLTRIPTIFSQVISAVPLYDHRLALYSYLNYYQAEIAPTTDALRATFPDGGTLRATFDALGRLAALNIQPAPSS